MAFFFDDFGFLKEPRHSETIFANKRYTLIPTRYIVARVHPRVEVALCGQRVFRNDGDP